MGAVEGASEGTIMAKLCPSAGAGNAPARAPTEALAALAANSPCKWNPAPIEDREAMPGVGRETLVRIGATVYELRQAPWAMGHPAGDALIGESDATSTSVKTLDVGN